MQSCLHRPTNVTSATIPARGADCSNQARLVVQRHAGYPVSANSRRPGARKLGHGSEGA